MPLDQRHHDLPNSSRARLSLSIRARGGAGTWSKESSISGSTPRQASTVVTILTAVVPEVMSGSFFER